MTRKFTVLHGGKKEKPDYGDLYGAAMVRSMEELARNSRDKDNIKRVIFYSIKFIGTGQEKDADYTSYLLRFRYITILKQLIAQLTPAEFLTIFPVDKEYAGEKNATIDYLYTMREIHKLGINKPIGEHVVEFLCNYTNMHVRMFVVEAVDVIDRLRKAGGQKSILEKLCEQNGVKIRPCIVREDARGRKYIVDGTTGKTIRVRRKLPRYLRPVPAGWSPDIGQGPGDGN